MAPRIDEALGFEIVINVRDHPPPHVHILRDEAELRVYLTGQRPAERKYGRMKSADERRAIALVRQNRAKVEGDRSATMTVAIREKEDFVNAPYALYAVRADASRKRLRIALTDGVVVEIPIKALGSPWTEATSAQIARVRLRMGGSWLWWDALGEGLVLDELLSTTLKLNPAVLLARRARGHRASPAKAAAARKNGRKGGRPRAAATSKR